MNSLNYFMRKELFESIWNEDYDEHQQYLGENESYKKTQNKVDISKGLDVEGLENRTEDAN